MTLWNIAELEAAERDSEEKAQRAEDLLRASRRAYEGAQRAAAYLRERIADAAESSESMADWPPHLYEAARDVSAVYVQSAEKLLDIETRVARIAAEQAAAAQNDAQAARERLRALTAALPASERAGDVLGGPAAPSAADAFPALDEEN